MTTTDPPAPVTDHDAGARLAGVSRLRPVAIHDLTTPAGPVRLTRRSQGRFTFFVLALPEAGAAVVHSLPPVSEREAAMPPDELRALLVDHHLLSHPEWLWPWKPAPPEVAPWLAAPRSAIKEALALKPAGHRATVCAGCAQEHTEKHRSTSRSWGGWVPPPSEDCEHAPALRKAARAAIEAVPTLPFELLGWLRSDAGVDPSASQPVAGRFLLAPDLIRGILASWLIGRELVPSSEYSHFGAMRLARPARLTRRPRVSWKSFADWGEQDSPWLRGAVSFAAQAWSFTTPPPALLARHEERSAAPLSFGPPPAPSTAPRLLPDIAQATPASTPARAAKAPQKAAKAPQKAAKAPQKAAKVPEEASKASGKASEASEEASKGPKEASKASEEASKGPKEASKGPKEASKVTGKVKASGKASKVAERPVKAAGKAAKAPDEAPKASGKAAKASEKPAKASEKPAKASRKPAKVSGEPAKSSRKGAKGSGKTRKVSGETPTVARAKALVRMIRGEGGGKKWDWRI